MQAQPPQSALTSGHHLAAALPPTTASCNRIGSVPYPVCHRHADDISRTEFVDAVRLLAIHTERSELSSNHRDPGHRNDERPAARSSCSHTANPSVPKRGA
jgi:hypothetical protein